MHTHRTPTDISETKQSTQYEGEFDDGKMHGICTETNLVANQSRKGVWRHGKFTSEILEMMPSQ